MKVKIDYKNKELEIINSEVYEIDLYCHLLSQRVLSLLYLIEDYNNNKLEFVDIKHNIFDIAGQINRLPINLLPDCEEGV